jgi:hypothetical protein
MQTTPPTTTQVKTMNEPYLCPMINALWNWDEDNRAPINVKCNEEVHLVYESYVPLSVNDGSPTGVGDATYNSWSVKCLSGHVLATSIDEDGNGDPPPFDWDLLP